MFCFTAPAIEIVYSGRLAPMVARFVTDHGSERCLARRGPVRIISALSV